MEADGINQIMGPLCQAFKQIKDDSLELMLDLDDDDDCEQLGF